LEYHREEPRQEREGHAITVKEMGIMKTEYEANLERLGGEASEVTPPHTYTETAVQTAVSGKRRFHTTQTRHDVAMDSGGQHRDQGDGSEVAVVRIGDRGK